MWRASTAEDDAALVHAARHGDRSAFAVLVDRHLDLVRSLCVRWLADPTGPRGRGPAVDARPSDALNIAVLVDAPVRVHPEVVTAANGSPGARRPGPVTIRR
ncbi:bifunctional nuclease domain-containing protein [Pseudonocardia xinjiangensis]|uniref:bifunctional nuclease domain-containing protein n=1 Tax=Pseudonocardia xinjiangensis TaxID=75289 RepID=UPI003D94ACFF